MVEAHRALLDTVGVPFVGVDTPAFIEYRLHHQLHPDTEKGEDCKVNKNITNLTLTASLGWCHQRIRAELFLRVGDFQSDG